jgi:hypothetical protein
MLAGDTGLNGSFDATEAGWLAQYASDYDGPGKGSNVARFRKGVSSCFGFLEPSVVSLSRAVWALGYRDISIGCNTCVDPHSGAL